MTHQRSPLAEWLMVGFVILVLLILFTPIPAALLDMLLIINFSWALMMLLLTLYIDKPLSFSTFPALLLISTLFRLALNISATRLILSDASAGRVIEAMGHYVIQGNYVMGMVVFLIVIIVQYIVVTNGAQRVAEVAARFTLDSMPGKQMSIDADLNMGLISQDEAKLRRQALEKETNFYGAMDGASKFVKGDAIAGILIVLVDIIGGFIIGLVQKNMGWLESIQTYTVLTVGDGLITQIPALIISTATGIIVTRAATDAQLGTEVARQIAAQPKSLIMVCAALFAMLLLPGMPGLPVLLILGGVLLATGIILKKQRQEDTKDHAAGDNQEETELLEQMKIHPIELCFGEALYSEIRHQEAQLLKHIQKIRHNIAMELGMRIPAVKFKRDASLNPQEYHIVIQGNTQAQGLLEPSRTLAINHQNSHLNLTGMAVRDPNYGLPAVWIDDSQLDTAQQAGFTLVPGILVLMTHVSEVLKKQCAELLSRQETEELLQQPHLQSMRDELIPKLLSLSQVQKILQQLLQEGVSIREMENIVEILLEHAQHTAEVNALTEQVRIRLAKTICRPLLNHQASLTVLTIAPSMEQIIHQSIANEQIIMEPAVTEQFIHSLIRQVEIMLKDNKRPVLLCSPRIRRYLRQLTVRVIPHLSVLSMNEIPLNINVEAYGVIE
ncbi:MAG: FHIPEP family type III secretion protein [Legionellaceae bacterium]|nr:FHIPEP family type III secretion protein [Legionellaceae bacterium]